VWLFLEERGIKPSARKVSAMLRAAGVSHNEHDVRSWVRPFADQSAVAPRFHRTRNTAQSTAGATALPEHASPHETPQSAPHVHRADSTLGYAREKEVSLVSNTSETTVSSESVDKSTQDALLPEINDQRRKPRSHEPTRADLAAYAILTAAYAIVTEHHTLGMTMTTWKQRNKAAALDLVRLGKTPADVTAMLEAAYADQFARNTVMLAKLQELWPKIESRMQNGPGPPRSDLASVDERLRALR